MSDKVQLIKEEIERLDNKYRELRVSGTTQQAKESDLVVHVLLQISNFIDSLPEESASEDLEEEVNNWRHNHFHGRRDKDASGEYLERESQLDLARHFAEWQKQKDFEELLKSDMSKFKECYEKGRFDMREEMMKNAIEVVVTNTSFIPLPKLDIKAGDKVKIIIVKED